MMTPPTDALRRPAFTSARSVTEESENEREVIQLFEQFRSPLLRYVVSLGLSFHDGEEVIQEVFLALFRHLQLGRPRSHLRGWIFRVAHNLALKRRHANSHAQAMLQMDDDVMQRQPDRRPNPEEQFASKQGTRRMLAVLRALPEMDRCCLYLRAEGLRYREIAEALGISLGSVSIALTRALARMGRVNEK